MRTFNFPGWTGSIDGQRVPIATERKIGAMLLQVPAGRHVVTLDFVDTPARRLGAWISGVSLIITFAVLAIGAVIAL